ncbi:hypothetical protein BVY01_04490 [bacterium I07]|nr:hypothetical protein BVY01_04490 [bacterium I07]
MRKMIVFMLALMLTGTLVGQGTVDVEKEKAEIKEVLENSFKELYNKKSFEGWANTTVQDDNIVHAWAWKTKYGEDVGWDKISADVKKTIGKDPEPSKTVHIFENYRFRIWRDAAFVSFDYSTKEEKEMDPDHVPYKCYHMFEKTKDGWKYVNWINIRRNSWRETE